MEFEKKTLLAKCGLELPLPAAVNSIAFWEEDGLANSKTVDCVGDAGSNSHVSNKFFQVIFHDK